MISYYQIDIVITFDFLGADFKVLVECKRYNSAIKRETVQILRDKTQILGAHKGILVSASGFQKGAIDYARNHGIALVRIINGEMSYETKSFDKSEIKIPDWIDLPDYIFLWIQGVDDKSIVVTSFNSDYINEFESKILNDNKSPL
jgi:restriction system protein